MFQVTSAQFRPLFPTKVAVVKGVLSVPYLQIQLKLVGLPGGGTTDGSGVGKALEDSKL